MAFRRGGREEAVSTSRPAVYYEGCNNPTTKAELWLLCFLFSLILCRAEMVKGFGLGFGSGPRPPLLRVQLRDVLWTVLTGAPASQVAWESGCPGLDNSPLFSFFFKSVVDTVVRGGSGATPCVTCASVGYAHGPCHLGLPDPGKALPH